MLIMLYQKMISREVGILTKTTTRFLLLWIKEHLTMVVRKPIKFLMVCKRNQTKWVMLQAKEVLSNATKNVKSFLITYHLCRLMGKLLIKFPKKYVHNTRKKILMQAKQTHKKLEAWNQNSIIAVNRNRAKLFWIIMQSWTRRICN